MRAGGGSGSVKATGAPPSCSAARTGAGSSRYSRNVGVVGGGATTWHGLAEEIFRLAGERIGRRPRVAAIATADYPTPARRPANSVLDTAKLTATEAAEKLVAELEALGLLTAEEPDYEI